MNRLIAVAFMLLCAACAPVTVKTSEPDLVKAESVSVVDVRPINEKEHEFFSLLITSKEYGIMRIGDAKLEPRPISLLRYKIYEKFAHSGNLPKVIVNHFVIYLNAEERLRAGSRSLYGGGILSDLMINKATEYSNGHQSGLVSERVFDSLASNEYQRGLYSATENSSGSPVYIVYVETEIDGRKVFTRTIWRIDKQKVKDALADAAQLAIKNHLDQYDVPATSASTSAADASQATHVSSSQTPAVAGTKDLAPSASAAAISMAQATATQMGCGAVQDNGDSTFTAACGSYDVLISCNSAQCRPLHTISIKSDK